MKTAVTQDSLNNNRRVFNESMLEITSLATSTTSATGFDDSEERLFFQQFIHAVLTECRRVDFLADASIVVVDLVGGKLVIGVVFGEQGEGVQDVFDLLR